MWFAVVRDAFAQDATDLKLTITTQPSAITIVQKNESATLSCAAEKDDHPVSYQWYANTENKNSGGTPIADATDADFATPPFSDKEIRYYYCVATADEETVTSNVAVAAYTGLPTIFITTVDGEEPTAEYAYPPSGAYGRGLTNATKVPSSMQIIDGDGNTVYDSGEYVAKESGLTIKLRGNTSANLTGKSPYKLKLQKKADLLSTFLSRTDKEYKDKEWILLKDGTSLKTFIGMTVTDIAGAPWTPEFIYANVVINNNYRGVYMLIEAISRGEKRIDVAKNGYIIERDAYWWNEEVKFITTKYNQKYTFKYPDDEDIPDNPELLTYIENYMNTLEQHVADGTYGDYIDVESFARWLLVHDILGTWDAGGSNMYMYKYDNTDATKVCMSTNWDFDTMYRQTDTWANQHNGSRIYASYLFQSSNRTFIESYQTQWESLQDNIRSQLSTKLQALKDELGNEIDMSRRLDAIRWKGSFVTVEANITEAQKWFASRGEWMENAIEAAHTITYELNGGNFAKGADYPESFKFDDVLKIANPTKTGYVFSGWKYGTSTALKNNLTFYGCTCFSDLTFTANWKKLLTNSDVVISDIPEQTYSGNVCTPSVTITDNDKKLVANTDYTIALPSGRINTGSYTVKITGQGNYSGTVTKTFTITPSVTISGALTITTDQSGTSVVIDGTSNEEISIADAFTANKVTYKRTFSGDRASTVMLPFDFDANEVDGSFHTLQSYAFSDGEATITMSAPITDIKANTPYIFKPSEGASIEEFVFERTVELEPTSEIHNNGIPEWQLNGVYAKKVWKSNTQDEYGFASVDDPDNEIVAGEFVRAGKGASIKATRCYLKHVAPISKNTTELPERIKVVFPKENDDIVTPTSEVIASNNTKVWSYDKIIYIEATSGQNYQIFDLMGRTLKNGVTTSDREEVSLRHVDAGILVVRTGNKSYKIIY